MPAPWEKYSTQSVDVQKPWEKYSAQQPAQDETLRVGQAPSARNVIGATVEPALAIGSSMVAGPVSDIAGLAAIPANLIGLTQREPEDVQRQVREKLTYEPRTAGGKYATEALTYLPRKYGELAGKVGEFVGGGEPITTPRGAYGQVVGASLEQLPAVLGLKGEKVTIPEKSMKLDTFKDARAKGYVATPSAVKDTTTGSMLESMTNKSKMTAATSIKNARARGMDIRDELGLEKGFHQISPDELEGIRQDKYKVYDKIANADYGTEKSALRSKYGATVELKGLRTKPNDAFQKEVNGILNEASALNKEYPAWVTGPRDIEAMREQLLSPEHDPKQALNLIKQLRAQSSRTLDSAEGFTPEVAKALMQYKAAGALETLFEENLKRIGKPELIKEFRDARTEIAKTYSIQKALNLGTGEISGLKLAAQLDKGEKLTGALERAAKFAKAFKTDNRDVAAIGGHPPFSAWDFLVSGGTAMSGHPGVAMAELGGRGLTPKYLTSERFQSGLIAPPRRPSGAAPYIGEAFSQNEIPPKQ